MGTYPYNHLSCPKCAQQMLAPLSAKVWTCHCCGWMGPDEEVVRDGLEHLDGRLG